MRLVANQLTFAAFASSNLARTAELGCSSMVEHVAVNHGVAGSSPADPATGC